MTKVLITSNRKFEQERKGANTIAYAKAYCIKITT